MPREPLSRGGCHFRGNLARERSKFPAQLRKPIDAGPGEAVCGKKQTYRLTYRLMIDRHQRIIERPAELPEVGGDASHIQILQEQVGYEG